MAWADKYVWCVRNIHLVRDPFYKWLMSTASKSCTCDVTLKVTTLSPKVWQEHNHDLSGPWGKWKWSKNDLYNISLMSTKNICEMDAWAHTHKNYIQEFTHRKYHKYLGIIPITSYSNNAWNGIYLWDSRNDISLYLWFQITTVWH